ncbi:hypothetical protein EDD11_002229 [Mortierella claussenii]|nr:hypothetical protein EDD11_002229 [Mortierella claussenii]
MSSNIEYSLEEQQDQQLYMFRDDRCFSKVDSAHQIQMLLKDGDLFMEDGSNYQGVKMEGFEGSTACHRSQGQGQVEGVNHMEGEQQQHHHPFHPHGRPGPDVLQQPSTPLQLAVGKDYHHHLHQRHHRQRQQHLHHSHPSLPLAPLNPSSSSSHIVTTVAPNPHLKASALDMFKNSADSYLTPSSGSVTSNSSSKALTFTSERSSDQSMSQETEDANSSSSSSGASNHTTSTGMSNGGGGGLAARQHGATLYQNSENSQSTLNPQQQQTQFRSSLSSLGASSSSSSSIAGTGSNDTTELPEDVAFRRAEQNRAAQRAFRQRKQKYIKWLEGKAEELDEVYRIMALVRAENQQLYNMVMELDEKLNGPKRMGGHQSSSSSGGAHVATSIASNGSSSNSRSGATQPASTAALLTGDPALPQTGGAGVEHNHGIRNRPIQGLDESLAREISMRLMNLATFPGLGLNEDRDVMSGEIKYRPRSSTHSKGSSAKGKIAFKMNHQNKQQGALLQVALQPGPLSQQHQQQQPHPSGDVSSGQDHTLHPQDSVPWTAYSPTSSSASPAAFYSSSSPSHPGTLSPHVTSTMALLISAQPNTTCFSPTSLATTSAGLQDQQQALSSAITGFAGVAIQDYNLSSGPAVSAGATGVSMDTTFTPQLQDAKTLEQQQQHQQQQAQQQSCTIALTLTFNPNIIKIYNSSSFSSNNSYNVNSSNSRNCNR